MQMPSTDSDQTVHAATVPNADVDYADDETQGNFSQSANGYQPPVYDPNIDNDAIDDMDDMSQSIRSDHTMKSVLESAPDGLGPNAASGNEDGLPHIEENGFHDDESMGGRSDAATKV